MFTAQMHYHWEQTAENNNNKKDATSLNSTLQPKKQCNIDSG